MTWIVLLLAAVVIVQGRRLRMTQKALMDFMTASAAHHEATTAYVDALAQSLEERGEVDVYRLLSGRMN